ncbi:MAG: hypothetical protein RL375_692 [Pseudomonadota bacterium]
MPSTRKTRPGSEGAGPGEPGASTLVSRVADESEIETRGRVERRRLAAGTKSERLGEVLVGDDGVTWTLRRQGGPAFGDAALAVLDGRRVRARGTARGTLLLLRGWELLD